MHSIQMYRGSISFVLIVAQLSVAYDPLNVHQIQTTGDPSSPLPVFPGDDSGFTGISGISNPEDPMVDGGQRRQNQDSFNNDGNFELVSGGKGCPPGQNGRGKRRARRSNPEFCPATLQNNPSPNKPQEAGKQQGGSRREQGSPRMQQDPPKIPDPDDSNPDAAPILLEQLDLPQPNIEVCPWKLSSIPICAKWEDTDDSQDLLPGIGYISDFRDIVHWSRYDPEKGCPEESQALFCCHFVKPQPILQNPVKEQLPEADLSSPLHPFDGWFGNLDEGQSTPAQPTPEKQKTQRDPTATLCRPGPSAENPAPQSGNH